MTCVWNGLIKKLNLHMNPNQLYSHIKTNNKIIENVIVNEETLTETQKKENYERIQNITKINDGYDMSTCDPLLILISEIYEVNINHKFNNCNILYKNNKANKNINVFSNKSHFW
jgi:hypothetical protein